MKTKRIRLGLLMMVACLSSPLFAADGKLQLALTGSEVNDLSAAQGIEFGYRINDSFRLVLGYSELTYEAERSFGTMQFSDNLDQKNMQLKLDWYPWDMDTGIYASLAVVHLDSDSNLSTTLAAGNYTLNGTLYNNNQLGTLSGEIKTRTTVPYVGIGYTYGFSAQNKPGVFVQLEAGSVFGLKPEIELTSSNGSFGTLAADLQAEADEEETKLDDYYYLGSLTVGYRF